MFDVQQPAAGEWAVVAAGSRALLVAATDRERLVPLHRAVRSGFAETLDALVAGGLSRTPAFALLDASQETVLLAVRGTASALVREPGAGEREVRASGVSSWVELQLATATGVTLGGVGGSGAELPLADGVVLAGALVWSRDDADADAGRTVAAPPRRERDTGPVDALPADEATALHEAVASDEQSAAGEAPAPDAPAPDAPDAPDAPAAPAPTPEAPAPVDQSTRIPEATLTDVAQAEAPLGETSGYDHLFGATMMRSVEEAAVRPEEAPAAARIDLPGFITDSFPPAAGRLAGDHDGLTVMSGDLPRRAPAPEPEESAPSAPEIVNYTVRLSDGRTEPLSTPVVVGRAPSGTAVPTLRGVRPVTLTSAEDDISRSHVAVSVEGDSVVVTDLHSRNGTLIVLPGKSPQKLRAGEPTTVVLGTVIDLGSGATLTVEVDG